MNFKLCIRRACGGKSLVNMASGCSSFAAFVSKWHPQQSLDQAYVKCISSHGIRSVVSRKEDFNNNSGIIVLATEYHYPYPLCRSAWVGFSSQFVCLFVCFCPHAT